MQCCGDNKAMGNGLLNPQLPQNRVSQPNTSVWSIYQPGLSRVASVANYPGRDCDGHQICLFSYLTYFQLMSR